MIDRISGFCSAMGSTLKSCVKIALGSRRCTLSPSDRVGDKVVVMGNGPSLAETIKNERARLDACALMAVNFAIKSAEFFELRPEYYVMIDPAFFGKKVDNADVDALWEGLSVRVDWPMTVIVPACAVLPADLGGNPNLKVRRINPVGVEGFGWFEDAVYGSGLGMPRPRNVLIGALMASLRMGYGDIYVVGADHTWTENLAVNERNELCAVENHFYKEDESAHARRQTIYNGIRMHEMMYSLYVAFRSYFSIERFARGRGARIINATPHSFIDAFRRGELPKE